MSKQRPHIGLSVGELISSAEQVHETDVDTNSYLDELAHRALDIYSMGDDIKNRYHAMLFDEKYKLKE